MKLQRRRDNQQWILDWLVKTTGRVQNFAYDERLLPPEIKSYAMIPRVMARKGFHIESIARAAEAAGHCVTARELYWRAADHYREGQHAIFRDDDREKLWLHGKLLECWDKVIAYATTPIERVEIPFGEERLQGLLFLVPDAELAPTVVFCPGMDMTKEKFIDPFNHPFIRRGINCLQLDGPGQGISNIRKIRVTLDNYDAAASCAIDYLLARPEVDATRIGVSGYSMGSYWGTRVAASDSRVRAVATAAACYGPMTGIFEQASPRFKQVFMYMTGIQDEQVFDEFAGNMSLEDLAEQVKCPSLMIIGEYDPLSPLEEAMGVYRKMPQPKELWVIEDDFHMPAFTPNLGGSDIFGYIADWLGDALNGGIEETRDRVVVVPRGDGLGPYEPETSLDSVHLPGRLLERSGQTNDANRNRRAPRDSAEARKR